MNTQQLTYADQAMQTLKHLQLGCANGGSIEIGTVHFLAGQRSPAEGATTHHHKEVSLVLTGLLEVTSGGVKHTVGAGSLLEIPPGEEHYTMVLQNSKVLYLMIDT